MVEKAIRIGVVGLGRGKGFLKGAATVGMETVAICDVNEEELRKVGAEHGVATYVEYDRFLEHDMDAVVLANYFHEHAPFAIKALVAGFHVMSETAASKTLGEAVELVEAVERSGKIYYFAENYPFMAYIQEMRRLYRADEIGELRFGEGEYMHSMSARTRNRLAPGLNHWRSWCPSTYYCSHAMGPLMYVTGLRPVAVNARSVPRSVHDQETAYVARTDQHSVNMCCMDNGAVVVVNGLTGRGHGNWYRLHGSRGAMENLRRFGEHGMLRVTHDDWDLREGDEKEKIYTPEFPVEAELARQAGHGGGDFFTNYWFAHAIRTGEEPWFNVYRGLDMCVIGIQGWKSVLDNGATKEVPDFRTQAARDKYRGEMWSPFPEDRDAVPDQPPPSVLGMNPPTATQIAAAERDWAEG